MRGHIQQRGVDSWRLKVSLGRSADGRKRYVERTVRGTRADAERELAQVCVEHGQGRYAAAPSMTMSELLDRWLVVKGQHVEASTLVSYDWMQRTYLRPALGHRTVASLRPLDLDSLYAELHGRGLSARTVRICRAPTPERINDRPTAEGGAPCVAVAGGCWTRHHLVVHLYSGTTVEFVGDTTRNAIATKLEEAFFQHFRYEAPKAEVRAWQNSLRAMATALDLGGFDDHGIVVEYQLPLSSKRLDCMVTGTGSDGRRNAVIVELKQWEAVDPAPADECVTTFLAGTQRTVLHPSCQVGQYKRYLADMNTAFSSGDVVLNACAYLHNLRLVHATEIRAPRHRKLMQQCPSFAGDEVDDLVAYLEPSLSGGEGGPVLERVLSGRFRPHKRLLDHTARVIRREPSYVLLDDQEVVLQEVLAQVRAQQLGTSPATYVVRGGPGTGKSLIALNLVAELSAQGYSTFHATGSRAFTENVRRKVGTRAGAQFKYFNSFMEVDGPIDVIICDEAHRIREFSWNRFTPAGKRSERLQIDELLDAAKTCVFFIDDMQVVRPGEIGSTDLIKDRAAHRGMTVVERTLETQFRCGGSDGFVQWVDNTLELRRTPRVLWDADDQFEFDLVDSPEELEALIRSRNADATTARLSAGYCWRWSKPNHDGSLVADVKVDGWSMPWNAQPDAARLAAGIPKANFWADHPGGIDQVGCVYTAQGFEYDYAGVIFGRDLVYRHGEGWIGQPEHSYDSVVKRSAGRSGSSEFTRLVKQTYRVLLTRGLKGCFVYFQDRETRNFVLSRLESS